MLVERLVDPQVCTEVGNVLFSATLCTELLNCTDAVVIPFQLVLHKEVRALLVVVLNGQHQRGRSIAGVNATFKRNELVDAL